MVIVQRHHEDKCSLGAVMGGAAVGTGLFRKPLGAGLVMGMGLSWDVLESPGDLRTEPGGKLEDTTYSPE